MESDILTSTENISIGARGETGRPPISSCPQDSSEIASFHLPSPSLKGPKQEITAFLKPVFSIYLSLSPVQRLYLLRILAEKAEEAQWQFLIVVSQSPFFLTFLITPQLVKLFHLYIYHSYFWELRTTYMYLS